MSPPHFANGAGHRRVGLYGIVFLVSVVMLCLPLLLTPYAPLKDYPNHLARVYILAHYGDVPLYQQNYVLSQRLVPNLAMDLIVGTLLRFVDLPTASRVFLCLTVVLFAGGCDRLGKAIHGHRTWLAIPCSFFVYNSMLLYGWVNYVFGLGYFCWALAYWLPRRRRWTTQQLAIATLLTFGAYVVHLTAYVFLGAVLVTICAWDVWKGHVPVRSTVFSLLPLVPPAVFHLTQTIGQRGVGIVIWNTLSGKVIAVLPLFLSYSRVFDLVFFVGLGVICMVALRWSERLELVQPSFLAGLVLLGLLLVAPKVVLASGADARFFPPAAILLLLSTKVTISRRVAAGLLLACLALFAVRVGAISMTWTRMDRRIAEQVAMFSVLPEGARVYPVFPSSQLVSLSKEDLGLMHVISLATITRHAHVFSQFATGGQAIVLFRKKPLYEDLGDMPDGWLPDLAQAEYVWSYTLPKALEEALTQRCARVVTRGGFTIWKVTASTDHTMGEAPSRAPHRERQAGGMVGWVGTGGGLQTEHTSSFGVGSTNGLGR